CPFWRPNPFTSETVRPWIPSEVKASRTSSSLNDLMIAVTSFMRRKPPFPPANPQAVPFEEPTGSLVAPDDDSRFVPRPRGDRQFAPRTTIGSDGTGFCPAGPSHERASRAAMLIARSRGLLPLFSPSDQILIDIARPSGVRCTRGRAKWPPRDDDRHRCPNLRKPRIPGGAACPRRQVRRAWHDPCERLNFAETSRWTVAHGKDGACPIVGMRADKVLSNSNLKGVADMKAAAKALFAATAMVLGSAYGASAALYLQASSTETQL